MATTIAQIVEKETENTGKVHLYREGLFFKAYDRSAFLFQKHVRNFHPVKKYFKTVGRDVVMLGFPSANLPSVFPEGIFEYSDPSYIRIAAPGEINMIEYSLWFEAIQISPQKPKKIRRDIVTPATAQVSVSLFESVDNLPTTPGRTVIDNVVDELRAFPIENSTPMECMMFISRLKTELKKEKSGGLREFTGL